MAIGKLIGGSNIVPKTFHINRFPTLRELLLSWGWHEVAKTEPADFAYWDVFGNAPHVQARLNVWPRECTNVIDNIYPFFERLYTIPGMYDAAPVPFTVIGDAWRTLTREEFEQAPDSLWFLKDVFGRSGYGVKAVNAYEDYQREIHARPPSPTAVLGTNGTEFPIADRTIIQHAIRDTMTLAGGSDGDGCGWRKVHHSRGGRKTGLRAYIVTRGDGAVFLCEEMVCYVQEVPYDPTSTDKLVQHLNHRSGGSCAEFLLSTWDDQESVGTIVNNCMQRVKTLVPLWHSILGEHKEPLCDAAAAAAGSDAGMFKEDCHMLWHLWGVDFVPSMDNTVQLIGMKAWCQQSQAPAMRELYERICRGVMEILGFGDQVPPGPQPWKQLCEPLWLSERMPYYPVS